MSVKSLMFIAAAALGVLGSALAQPVDPYAALVGTHWRAIEIAGVPNEMPAQPTLAFGGNGALSGRGGCNLYTASYKLDDADPDRRRVAIRNTGWTKMACHGRPGEIDFEYGQALERTRRFEATPGALITYDQAGAATLRFVPAAAPTRQ